MPALLLALAPGPLAAQELLFSQAPILTCLEEAADAPARLQCVGAAATDCITRTPGGGSTVAMTGCLDRELQFWDARLNATYRDLRAQERAEDADAGGAPGAGGQSAALLAMQRAWIPYRDAACEFERSQWGGGTGGGPASVGCLMQRTAEQALYLESHLAEQ